MFRRNMASTNAKSIAWARSALGVHRRPLREEEEKEEEDDEKGPLGYGPGGAERMPGLRMR